MSSQYTYLLQVF